jgi:hypothetical protein
MNSGFRWVINPQQQLIPNIEEYGRKALVAVQAVANYWGQMNQDEARQEARWEDRTGNARGGIFFAVDGFGLGTITGTVTVEAESGGDGVTVEQGDQDTLVITLGHTMFYGKFLELSNGGRYAIIMSTLERNLSGLERMLKDTFA